MTSNDYIQNHISNDRHFCDVNCVRVLTAHLSEEEVEHLRLRRLFDPRGDGVYVLLLLGNGQIDVHKAAEAIRSLMAGDIPDLPEFRPQGLKEGDGSRLPDEEGMENPETVG